jgi:uncharacterized delta-60 repeat protein
MNFIRTFLLAAALTLLTLLNTASLAWADKAETQSAGTLDVHFNPAVGDPSSAARIEAMAVQPDGKVIFGGDYFYTVGGAQHQYLARLNPDGSVDASFNAITNTTVNTIAVQADGKILVGGVFTTVNGKTRNRIARLNADGSLDESFTASADLDVNRIVVQADGKIVIGGYFTQVNDTTHNYIARLTDKGILEDTASFNPGTGPDNGVSSIAVQADGKIVLGGFFTAVNGKTRNHIARLTDKGILEDTTTFNPGTGANAPVLSVAVQADGKIVLGGHFSAVDGETRNCIARLNPNGGVEKTTTFDPGTGTNNSVFNVAVQADGKIVLSGFFTFVNGTLRNYVARLNSNGKLEDTASFNPGTGLNQGANSMLVQADGKIVLGGTFTTVNGTARNYVARLNNDAATQRLMTPPDSRKVLWNRGGAGPELSQVTFEQSTDAGVTWTLIPGSGTRIETTSNWQLAGVSLPPNAGIRARGRTAGGSGLIEEVSALQKLKEGNQRYAEGKVIHPNQSPERRKELAAGQNPFAIIVGCGDSRVPPETAFDQGLGDVFVVRNAGEVLDDSSLGSIEYAVGHFQVSLIVVLGHEKCGAVDAAIHYDPSKSDSNHPVPEHVKFLVEAIKPAVVNGANDEETLELSVKQNARKVAGEIRSELDREHLDKEKQISIVTGYYDLDTGKVMFYQ